jgi:hypothetical protein
LQPTFTPTPLPTATPEATAVLPQPSPTKAPVIVVAQPTNTPVPTRRAAVAPTATPPTAPAQPQIASVPENEFKLVKLYQLTPCENSGNHHFHVLVLDKNGNGLPNMQIQFIRDDGQTTDVTGKKAENIPFLGVDGKTTAGYLNWPIYKGRARVKVLNGSSDLSDWVTVDLPDQPCVKGGEIVNPIGNSLFHFSYLAVFQRTR